MTDSRAASLQQLSFLFFINMYGVFLLYFTLPYFNLFGKYGLNLL